MKSFIRQLFRDKSKAIMLLTSSLIIAICALAPALFVIIVLKAKRVLVIQMHLKNLLQDSQDRIVAEIVQMDGQVQNMQIMLQLMVLITLMTIQHLEQMKDNVVKPNKRKLAERWQLQVWRKAQIRSLSFDCVLQCFIFMFRDFPILSSRNIK